MPSVATISVDYSNFNDFVDLNRRRTDRPVNALNFAKYCLYNRDLPDFGLNNSVYLSHVGGFITQDNKLNIKYSDLQIRKSTSTSSDGNLHVSGSSDFFKGVSLGVNSASQPTSTIKNARRLASVNDLKSTVFDKDPLTIKDFKNFMYHPGMITFYNGTWEDVRDKMPFWRICALPDAGRVVKTLTPEGREIEITIPNLLGKFLPGAVPVDRPDPGMNNYKTGDTGGHDAIKLIPEQMPTHDHNVNVQVTGDQPPVFGGLGNFYYSGGDTSQRNSWGRACLYQNIVGKCSCKVGTCSTKCVKTCKNKKDKEYCCEGRRKAECSASNGGLTRTAATAVASVTQVTIDNYTFRTLRLTNTKPVIVSETQSVIGGDGQHENRPQFYGLVPIIYVGVKR